MECRVAGLVRELLNPDVGGRDRDPACRLDPPRHVGKGQHDCRAVIGTGRRQGEVQVFRKPIGVEIALLEAGPTFEKPRSQLWMGGDSKQNPAERVVLLDRRREKALLLRHSKDLGPGDHGA